MKKQNFFKRQTVEKLIECSCGNKAKLSTRKNYPFGINSKPLWTKFYKCKSCGKIEILTKEAKGGRKK